MRVCFGVVALFLLCVLAETAAAQPNPKLPKVESFEWVYSPREVTKKAQVLDKPEPVFTEEAREHGVEGTITVRVVLGADGAVKNATAVTRLPDGLTERALDAARRIRFTPAEKDGRPVSQFATVEYNFDIIYDEKDKVERAAVILEQPAPEYTEEARLHNVRGTVVLSVVLHRNRGVWVWPNAVVKGLPYGLSEKAVEAARKIKFVPAQNDGHPISQLRTIEYRFPPE